MDNSNVIGRYPWYDNDILAQAIRVFNRTGKIHNEILESALGIAKQISDNEIKSAQLLGVQLRVVMQNMLQESYTQPPDAGQLAIMLCSDDYPKDVREKITDAMGFESLEEFIATTEGAIPGLESLR